MTTKQLSLTLLCLLLLAGTGYSQKIVSDAEIAEGKETARSMYWGNVVGMLPLGIHSESWSNPKFRTALGVSEEYYRAILVSERNARDATGSISELPAYQKAQEEYLDAIEALTGLRGAFGQRRLSEDAVDANALKRFNEAVKGLESISQEFRADANRRGNEALDNALTPELKQKLQDVTLATMALGESQMLFPGVFASALHLTDAQKEQMEQIKKELEPEFEKRLEIGYDTWRIMTPKIDEAFQVSVRAMEEARKRGENWGMTQQEANRKFLREDPEYQRALDKVYSSSKAFAKQFTARVSEILTDEQRKRLQELTDNPPEYVRLHIQRLRENRGERTGTSEEGKSERVDGEKDIWVPGPDSWKPGDPLPDDSRRPRNERGDFPRPAE